MWTRFRIVGPREVPTYKGKAGRTITDDDVRAFWGANHDVAKHRGCYVFGMRAGRGLTPSYVGKATRTFRQEVFQHHKLTRYQQQLADYRVGTPVLFFVVAPKRRGAPNTSHIAQLEAFLIQTALAANPALLNVRGTKAEQWGIVGVLRSGKGKPSDGAARFCSLMKLRR